MKQIKNESFTGKQIFLDTPDGPKAIWLGPKDTVVVPENQLSTTIKNLANRRVLKIVNA